MFVLLEACEAAKDDASTPSTGGAGHEQGEAGGDGGQHAAGGASGRAGGGGTNGGAGGANTGDGGAAGSGAAGEGRGGNTTNSHGDASRSDGGDEAGLSANEGGAAAKDGAADGSVGNPRLVLLCDEGNRRVLLVDLRNPGSAVWRTQLNDTVKYGDSVRDLQLVGGHRVAVSVAKGYVELDLDTGAVEKEVTKLEGVESLRRLPSGNTVLGANANGGVTLQELDPQDAPVAGHNVTFTEYSQLRMLRRTPQGTFLIAVGTKLAEVNWNKQTLWEMAIPGGSSVFQGLRLPDQTIAVTSGYGATILRIDAAKKTVLTTLGGKAQPDAATIVPNFYAGFQVLGNGHFVVTNWEGHGSGNGTKGVQLLEYDPTGALVWKWKQDPDLVSSLHNVMVLDGLDTTKLHDDVGGVLAPVLQ